MSGKKVAAIAGVAFAIQASLLWAINGWNATHGIIYIIGAVLIVSSGMAWFAERDD